MIFQERLHEEREEGRKEGRKEGKAEGLAEAVLSLLQQKGEVSAFLKELILSEKDSFVLQRYLLAASNAESVKDFMKKEQLLQ